MARRFFTSRSKAFTTEDTVDTEVTEALLKTLKLFE
jgi:hypothetical protein